MFFERLLLAMMWLCGWVLAMVAAIPFVPKWQLLSIIPRVGNSNEKLQVFVGVVRISPSGMLSHAFHSVSQWPEIIQ